MILWVAAAAAVATFPVFLNFERTQAAVPSSVSAYLSSLSQQLDWSIMARAALSEAPADAEFLKTLDGATANDYATYILAITALGKDPRSYGGENLVYGLEQKASGGQIGDSTLISDDMFGIMALRAAGVPATESVLSGSVSYIKSKQFSDGSWDFAAASTKGSADFTAMGIMALRAAGVPASDTAIVKAVDYLANVQNNDGGFPLASGESSNTESTAWALSALNALGENIANWKPVDASPVDYLNARIGADGYALFNATATGMDIRTPVTTSYAAIALSGKYYPVASITAPPSVNLRIEGKIKTLCTVSAQARTALDAVKNAAGPCGYTYVISDTQYGPYLTTIAGEAAEGLSGWSYLPNWELAQVGAGDHTLSEGDTLVWYYGAWDDKPLRILHTETTVSIGNGTSAQVERFEGGSWKPFAGATLTRGSETFTSDANGLVALSWPQSGVFGLTAEASGSVRSSRILVVAGTGAASQSLPMSVTVNQSNQQTPGGNGQPAVVFGVSGDLDFGSLAPGQSSTKTATVTNSGTVDVVVTATAGGANLFTQNILLDSVVPPSWQRSVTHGSAKNIAVQLSIPAQYSSSGAEQGTLIFWANPVE